MTAAETRPARSINRFFSRFCPHKSTEPDSAIPVAGSSPITQEERMEGVFSQINKCVGPVIDPQDPIDQAVLYLRMSVREEGK
jgi:hypothetical protein